MIEKLNQVWTQKASLRYVYQRRFKEIESLLVPGNILEIGCGNGMFTQYLGERCVGIDIDKNSTGANVIADAQNLPFRQGTFANVVAVNVFHHIHHPLKFLEEIRNVLKLKGRCIICEPYMGLLNTLVFRLFHHELCIRDLEYPDAIENNPHYRIGNYYLAHFLFVKNSVKKNVLADLKVNRMHIKGSVIEHITGGYNHPQLIPDRLGRQIISGRQKLPQSRIDASRLIIEMQPQ